MGIRGTRTADLGEDCVREALAIIGEAGVEGLSLREVARRLGVSHQAPYKHYPSRDHLLAEVVRRAFTTFAEHLDARPRGGDPRDDLAEMGRAYLGYALAHPLQYRLMFGTPLPDPARHPEMMRSARHAFSLLRDGIARLDSEHAGRIAGEKADLDALFVWSTVHGLASLLQTRAMDTLGLPPDVLEAAKFHTLLRLGLALTATTSPGEERLTQGDGMPPGDG